MSEKLAEDRARGALVNSNDLNDGKNRLSKEIRKVLNYSKDGKDLENVWPMR